MKRKLILLFAYTVAIHLMCFSSNIYKHQIIESEADKLNDLAQKIGVSGTGWPVSSEIKDQSPDVRGVSFVYYETKFIEVVVNSNNQKDSVFAQRYKVEGLYFSSIGLSGDVPKISFEELKSIDFSYNQLTGTLPEIDCPKITSISFSGNKLTGPIPKYNFANLTSLYLSSNQLSGEIPDFDLPKLEYLNLERNNLSGILPLFTGLPELKTLVVEDNQLTGIDKNFGLPKLEIFYAKRNKFSGGFPSINCPVLKSLVLSNYENSNYANKIGFSGTLPEDINLPLCITFAINHNQLTGPFPALNLPSVKYLDISFNGFTGELPALHVSMPNLVTIDAYYNKFSGQIPNFDLPQLIHLKLTYNNFEGNFPIINSPKLQTLYLDRNKIKGNIPDLNMPDLEELDLSSNQLSGQIPNFNFPKLEILDIANNQLTGSIPNFSCPRLEYLELQNNKLEGQIPNFNMPLLYRLILSKNNLTGYIPNFNFPKIDELRLDNNKLTGPIPEFNFPVIEDLYLGNNMLSDTLPILNLPKVRYLYLNNNQIEGTFDNSKLPNLYNANLSSNKFNGLKKITSYSPNLNSNMDVRNCRLSFEDIEPNLDLKYFYYEDQDSVEHTETISGNNITLAIKTGGTANIYKWFKKTNGTSWVEIPNSAKDSIVIPHEKGALYRCQITNTLATKLTLYSKKMLQPSCLSIKNLEFCAEAGEWESKEDNELGTTGKISINDLLMFEGTMTIDTAQLAVKAEGEFYIKDIPLPGGSIGTYSFCKGEYELKLMGEDGYITNFLNSKFEAMGELFGIGLKLNKLQLVGGRNANGIKIDCTVEIPGIAGGCAEENKDTKTAIDLTGLEFSTNGISLEGAAVKDLGMLLDGYCLKKLELSYDSQNDILTSGVHVALPFGEIGGGFKLVQGYIDSIAWHLEASKPPFVLGTTTIGIKGFFGHISNITDPAIEIELGGIFTDITSENFYLVNASGRTVWPSLFEVKGEGKFLKPPLIDKPYQVNGNVKMAYDHPLQLFAIDFGGKIGTSDEETWLLQGEGQLKLSTRMQPPVIAGTVDGTMTLPEFENKFPYDWLNSMFSFPVEANANATFVWGRSHVLHGTATFKTQTRGPYTLRYVIDLYKKYGDEGFIWFEHKVESKSAQLKSGSLTNTLTESFAIPKETELAVIGISSKAEVPVSTLTDPKGKVYNSASAAGDVVYSISSDKKKAFWTLLNPVEGNWSVVLQNPAAGDSIYLFNQPKQAELSLSFTQTGNKVTVNWDPSKLANLNTVTILLDDNTTGFDGFSVATGSASSGSLSFNISDSLSACNYYLFAQASGDNATIQSYANGQISNPKSILAPPVILSANFNDETGKTLVSYTNSTDNKTVGYVVRVTDALGRDSIYAILNKGGNYFELKIDSVKSKTISMVSFDTNGLMGCYSQEKGIKTNAGNYSLPDLKNSSLVVYPNPVTGESTIRFDLMENTHCAITIVDFFGRVIARPIDNYYPAGTHLTPYDFGGLAQGVYLMVLQTEKHKVARRIVVR